MREICDRYGIVYIADEVMCGFGRTGAWFAYQNLGVKPDLVTFAKGVNSGYVPLGGVVLNEAISAHVQRPRLPRWAHLLGTPARLRRPRSRASRRWQKRGSSRTPGASAMRCCAPASRRSPRSTESSARYADSASSSPSSWSRTARPKEPLAPYGASSPAMNEVLAACRNEGLLIFNNFHRLHVVPPCTITDDEAREGLARLDRALAVADQYYVGA